MIKYLSTTTRIADYMVLQLVDSTYKYGQVCFTVPTMTLSLNWGLSPNSTHLDAGSFHPWDMDLTASIHQKKCDVRFPSRNMCWRTNLSPNEPVFSINTMQWRWRDEITALARLRRWRRSLLKRQSIICNHYYYGRIENERHQQTGYLCSMALETPTQDQAECS